MKKHIFYKALGLLLSLSAGATLAQATTSYEYRVPMKGLVVGGTAEAPAAPSFVGDGISKVGACSEGTVSSCASWTQISPLLQVGYSGADALAVTQVNRASSSAYSSTCKSSGKWYFEMTHTGANSGYYGLTSTMLAQPLNNHFFNYSPTPPRGGSSFWGWSAEGAWQGTIPTVTLNGTTGLALDIDNRQVTLFFEGVERGTAALPPATWMPDFCPAASALAWNYAADTTTITANFGQAEFMHAVPAGFNKGWW